VHVFRSIQLLNRYRIRGDYFRSTADRANLNRQGPWVYFVVVK
jgi:hypothetical protein